MCIFNAEIYENKAGEMMFRIFKDLNWFFKHYWKRYTFAIVALIMASAIGLVPPKLIGFAIDQIQLNTLTMELLKSILLALFLLLLAHYAI